MAITFNTLSLKTLALKNYDFRDSDIIKLIEIIAKNLLSIKEDERFLNNSRIKTLSQIIFYKDTSDIEKRFKQLLENDKRFLLFEAILSLDDGIYLEKKLKFLNLTLQNVKQIISPFFNQTIAELKRIELNRHKAYLKEDKEQIFQRKAPLLGLKSSTKNIIYLEAILFLDEEIINVSRIISSKRLFENKGILAFKKISENNNTVIQQASFKSCGQTCLCMLLLDHNLQAPLALINEGESSTIKNLQDLLSQFNVKNNAKKIETTNSDEFLLSLKKEISLNGPCILSIQGLKEGRIGGHFIIVNEIFDDFNKIRIRDPFHGWEITITKAAFLDSIFDVFNKIYVIKILQIIS
jgi:hypothetical protein